MSLQRKSVREAGRRVRVLAQACQVEPLETRRLLATITGTVFNDLNGNGTQDAGELGVAGWQVFIDKNSNFTREVGTGETSGITDANGNYTIGGVTAGTSVKLAQIVKAGYLESTPGPHAGLTVNVPATSSAVTGADFAIQQAVVGGRVFRDNNQDGVRQGDEPGIGGVTVTVGTYSTLTSGSGIWGFAAGDIPVGTYTASQATLSNYAFSLPAGGTQLVTVNNASPATNYSFGNVPLRTISGTVVNDLNDNVARDAGEPGLAGWTVFVDYNGDTVVDPGEQTAVTAGNGTYTLTGIRPGSYFVRAVPQTNWKLRPAAVVATVTATSDATDIDFVPSQKARITGYLWYDLNANGVRDAGEPPQVGWGVYLDANSNGVYDVGEARQVTDANGKYLFTDLAPVSYKVRSQIPANWSDQPTNRSSNLYSPNTTGGAVITDKDFGYLPAASVAGSVFADTNADGIQDAGETALEGVRVFVDANANGTFDTGERSTLTAADGSYKLWSLPAGTYQIDFTPPGAMTSSAGTPNFFTVPLTVGQAVTGKNFGASGTITGAVAGQVFDDVNSNGTIDGGEIGVSGVRVYIDANSNSAYDVGEENFVVGAGGSYLISGLAAGVQRVAIVMPANYTVTGSTQVVNNVTVTSNATTTQNFSITQVPGTAVIGGFIFQDVNTSGTAEIPPDVALPGRQAFIDRNANGTYDAGTDTVATADGTGTFQFTGLQAGTYQVYPILNAGETISYGSASYSVTVTTGETKGGQDWGLVIPSANDASLNGFAWLDANDNGIGLDGGDALLTGRQVFIDVNLNGVFDNGTDVEQTTDGTGTFHFTGLASGNYTVIFTTVVGETAHPVSYPVSLAAHEMRSGLDFRITMP